METEEASMKDKQIRSGKESNILEIYGLNSEIDSYYDMSAPLQFTLTYCSGLSDKDYYNIISVAPDRDYFFSSYIVPDFHAFNARAPHRHSFFEFLIVLEGSIVQVLENKEYLYPVGTCCLLNQNVFHVERYIGEAKLFFIGMSVDFIRELLTHQTALFQKEADVGEDFIFQFLGDNIQLEKGKNFLDYLPVIEDVKNISFLHSITDRLLHTMMFPKFGSTYIIKGLICQLFQYLDARESYRINNVKLNSSSDQLLFSRIGHLMENTDGRMSRSVLEKVLCYSGNYLNTIVNKYSGMNLHDYGMTFTLKKAAFLLENTNQPISAIESQLGFTNRTHFYKVFKKKYGITPGKYRSRLKKTAHEP